MGLLQCLSSLPWCFSYPVLSTPEGYLIASMTSVIWSAITGSRGRRAFLARQVQKEKEGERTLCSLRLCMCVSLSSCLSTYHDQQIKTCFIHRTISSLKDTVKFCSFFDHRSKQREQKNYPFMQPIICSQFLGKKCVLICTVGILVNLVQYFQTTNYFIKIMLCRLRRKNIIIKCFSDHFIKGNMPPAI